MDEISGLLMSASTEAPMQHTEIIDLHGPSGIVTKGRCPLHIHLANTCSNIDKCHSGSLKLPCLRENGHFLGFRQELLFVRDTPAYKHWVKTFCKVNEKPKQTYYREVAKPVLLKMCIYEQP